jgi:hypothetical protein
MRMLSFSKPIFCASLVNLLGNSIVGHTDAAGLSLDPTWRHLTWILLLVPCIVVIIRDLKSPSPPRSSVTHVVFYVAVLYNCPTKLTEFDTYVYNALDSAFQHIPPTTIAGQTFEFNSFTATLGLLVHIVMMIILMTTAKLTLGLVAPANTRAYFLFPFQVRNEIYTAFDKIYPYPYAYTPMHMHLCTCSSSTRCG